MNIAVQLNLCDIFLGVGGNMFFKYSMILFKSLLLILVAIIGFWFLFLTTYLLAPSQLTDSISDEFTSGLESTYSPVTQFFKRVARREKEPFDLTFGFDSRWADNDMAVMLWFSRCGGKYADDDTAAKVVSALNSLQNRVPRERNQAKYVMERLQTRSQNFSVAIICLGMFTTIFAGLNSSEYSQAGRRFGSYIKIFAIVFPATVTAVTALQSLVAGQDQIAKQAQIHFGLIILSSEISSQLLTMNCPATANEAAPLLATLSDWNRRLSDIVASASRPSSEQPKHASSDETSTVEAGK
ncbi:hypothetical protein [Agrobacterium sp. NPDC090283]|uniref:hypothetical protein n=1 Tax=Agrobacterium sp. NPDC090283 TaxID=3363920 RepID=UPI00383B8803